MKLLAPMLAASLAICASTVFAQTETTTTTTTVETTTPSVLLPGGATYSVVNPNAGVVVSTYTAGQTIPSGYYVVEQNSGRVMATVDGSGRLVTFSSIPSVLPQRFLLQNGQLVYFNNDYAYRRAQLDQQIANEYAAGRLTNDQAKDLREELGSIARYETKRRSDLTYSRSTVRDIEKKFAEVQSDLAHDIADTNSRKAKIGIRVN